jgi:hypothetical protein
MCCGACDVTGFISMLIGTMTVSCISMPMGMPARLFRIVTARIATHMASAGALFLSD